ncbi:MBL fold metallo-hydrolase [Anaerospora sp.]|uniref:MBL fold metallo-hydrolase n=1 Tax=Anaerospora sp. TaxID=1960278 RepID=UPI00289C0C08|nr:MBL fold metallo-hydrolase [Anaerospora sp.]
MQKLDDDLYVITEAGLVHFYLILGQKKAVLIDAGFGFEDIRPIIRSITDLPVMLVLTHGDPDHSYGSEYFGDVWLYQPDYGQIIGFDTKHERQFAAELGVKFLKENNPGALERFDSEAFAEKSLLRVLTPHFIKDGEVFDLGGKALEVIFTPGHSYGHIMLLDRAKKRLFSGDMICDYVIIYFFESDRNAPFSMALDSWKKIKRLEQDIDDIFSSHGQNPITMDYVDAYIECFSGEFQQNYVKDKPFSRGHLGHGYQHIYKTVNIQYSDKRLEEFLGHKVERIDL